MKEIIELMSTLEIAMPYSKRDFKEGDTVIVAYEDEDETGHYVYDIAKLLKINKKRTKGKVKSIEGTHTEPLYDIIIAIVTKPGRKALKSEWGSDWRESTYTIMELKDHIHRVRKPPEWATNAKAISKLIRSTYVPTLARLLGKAKAPYKLGKAKIPNLEKLAYIHGVAATLSDPITISTITVGASRLKVGIRLSRDEWVIVLSVFTNHRELQATLEGLGSKNKKKAMKVLNIKEVLLFSEKKGTDKKKLGTLIMGLGALNG